jgi:hypothetical protein
MSKLLGSKLLWHQNLNNFEEITLMLSTRPNLKSTFCYETNVPELPKEKQVCRCQYFEKIMKQGKVWSVQILPLKATMASVQILRHHPKSID